MQATLRQPSPLGTPPGVPGGGARSFSASTARKRSFLLALLVHVALLAFLMIGIQWQTQTPDIVQAEIWSPPEVRPEPRPEPKPEPRPEPVVTPKVEPPAPVVQKPDIALEKQREAKLREEKVREEKLREEKLREDKARLEREEAEKARARKEEKTRRDEKAKKDEKERVEKAEKTARELERKLAEKQEKDREDYVKRLMEQAGKTTEAPKAAPRPGAAVGAAEGGASGGIDGDYIARLGSMIRSNTTFSAPPELAGNPKAVFTVLLAPDCSILSVKLKRSSGLGAWDQAAERGIARTDPFPRPRNGRCDTELEIARGPRDDR